MPCSPGTGGSVELLHQALETDLDQLPGRQGVYSPVLSNIRDANPVLANLVL